tara:strand:+ start:2638 stop:3165 length:528 start_codon:yes stop_codon:yes gene_type:complete
MINSLRRDLPNIPEDVLRQWLLPFAVDIGWPPNAPRWKGILRETDISYWEKTEWKLVRIHASYFIKRSPSFESINGLFEGVFLGAENFHSESMGKRSKERCHVQLHQLINHGKFREPLVLFDFGSGKEVVDGAHRMTAFLGWKFYQKNKSFVSMLKTKPVCLFEFQYAWVGTSNA